ncbi:MAG: ATP-binding protein, partial [bacterium]|nr:ATP-binding protein [bacterium]
RFQEYLSRWCERCPRPVVLFLDEIDALVDDTLLSILDQLHSGYPSRPEHFPHALALIGLRDVRDYKIVRRDGLKRVGSSSPFNIKSDSLTLRNFNAREVAELYEQHTEETGQRISEEAEALAAELTGGQPWLANALARLLGEDLVPDGSTPTEARHVEIAKETLIRRRDTHLDSLIDRLREDRVRKVIEPILTGSDPEDDVFDDDIQFVEDLGLIAPGGGGLEIANPI